MQRSTGGTHRAALQCGSLRGAAGGSATGTPSDTGCTQTGGVQDGPPHATQAAEVPPAKLQATGPYSSPQNVTCALTQGIRSR